MKNITKRLFCVLLSLLIMGSVLPIITPTTVEAASVSYTKDEQLVIPADVFATSGNAPIIEASDGENTYNVSTTQVTDDDQKLSLKVAAAGEGKVRQCFDLESWLASNYSAVKTTNFTHVSVIYRVADQTKAPAKVTVVAAGTTNSVSEEFTVDNSNRMYNTLTMNASAWTGSISSVSVEFDAWDEGDGIFVDSIIFASTAASARTYSQYQEITRNGGYVISGQDLEGIVSTSTNMSVEYDPEYRAAKLTVTGDGDTVTDSGVTFDLFSYKLHNNIEETVSQRFYNRIAFVYYMPETNRTTETANMRLWLQTSNTAGTTTTGDLAGTNAGSYAHVFSSFTKGGFTTETVNIRDMDAGASRNEDMIADGNKYHSKLRYKYTLGQVDGTNVAYTGDEIYIAAIIFYNQAVYETPTQANISRRVTAGIPSRSRYVVNFDANGGINPPGTHTETVSAASYSVTLPNTVPIRHGYNFQGWATTKDATEAEYTEGGNITMDGTVNATTAQTLYAVWAESTDVHRITYDLQGGTFEDEGAVQYTYPDPSLEFTMNTVPIRPGYEFMGWKVTSVSNGAQAWNVGDIIPTGTTLIDPAGDVTLEAQWMPTGTPVRYYLSSTYGTLSSSVEYVAVNDDGSTSTPVGCYPTGISNGYVFDGWYTDPACQTPVPDAWVTVEDGKLVPVLNVKTDGGAGVDTVLGYAFYAKVSPKTINFRISANCYDDESQTFLYRITGTPKLTAVFGESVSVTVAVLAEETKTVTLPVGDYIITEYVDWSWRYNDSVSAGETEMLEKHVATVSEYESECFRIFDYNIKKQDHWLNAYASSIEAELRKEDETAE